MQSNFTINIFDKYSMAFLKDIPKYVEKISKRVNKHFCKEEALAPYIWKDITSYLIKIITNLDNIYNNCYQKPVDRKILDTALSSVKSFNFEHIFRNK
jgi:hypothetical protein